MPRSSAFAIALLLSSPLGYAQQNNCGAIRTQIETKIRSSGVASFYLQVVDAEDKLPGKVVGTCDLGSKKIVYNSSTVSASASTPSKAKESVERILTECKDGSVTYGDCRK
jgi:hypothetical protein